MGGEASGQTDPKALTQAIVLRKGRRGHAKKIFKFRNAGTSLHDFSFKRDQVWVGNVSQGGSIKFIDHDLFRHSDIVQNEATVTGGDDGEPTESGDDPQQNASSAEGVPSAAFINRTDPTVSNPSLRVGLGLSSPAGGDMILDMWPYRETDQSHRPSLSVMELSRENEVLPPEQGGNLHGRAWRTHFVWPEAFEAHHCACLMHFFIEKIAPVADIGDPFHNAALVFPTRARQCQPLLNAVLTCAAIALFSSPAYRTEDAVCQYRGVLLPSLTYTRILQHHNACVADLIELCDNSAFAEDENLLAALISLRFHEEMDSHYQTEDKERLLSSTRIFLNAQIKIILQDIESPLSGNSAIDHPVLSTAPPFTYLKSFRHSLFRNALRQELTAAYMTQRSVQYPLVAMSFLDTLESSDYEDLIWSDRHLLHCARVLNFCYDSSEPDGMSNVERWRELKGYEARWDEQMPTSFLPLFEQKSSAASAQVLCRIWYLSTMHMTAVQFFELSRILLLAADPTMPRLGPRAVAARQRMSSEIRSIVLHVCSIAASYPELTPAWVQASMAIFIGGEFFTAREEQDALLGVLRRLEETHGWPSSHIARRLNHTWKREHDMQSIRTEAF